MSRPQGSFSAANHFSKPARGDGKDDDDIVRPLVGGVTSSRSSTLNILVILWIVLSQTKLWIFSRTSCFGSLAFCSVQPTWREGRELIAVERERSSTGEEGRVLCPHVNREVCYSLLCL